ncbi:hypothetical protein BC749_1011084 [Flavobacterium araucananum]|uniref:Uncharacterized protein n=1 Tax=Flavobacterium araucananum TaxID=946678 RepID=A0A227PKF5_9FLAO|nr:hypothetical protein [Flavobacterium araucananum]OXG09596.1 hypothetical protein B0A64_02250 [Flavobacterium araucananum]PWK02998.1 hypothetical protein BC749_1011084 [Flavobacterium araucananum]
MLQSKSSHSFLKKSKTQYSFLLFILFLFNVSAQNDTIYFDQNWKITIKESAVYYRINPLKTGTKKAIGYKIKNIDSLYVIKDYYLKSNKLQFEGYSKDKEGEYLVGKAKWYDENNNKSDIRDFNYNPNYNKRGFKIPEWPILYLGYSIATKSQFTGGLEICLACKDENKLFLGLGYGITSYDGKYYGLPDLHLSYNIQKSVFIKAGGSDKNAYALAGLTFLNMIDLGFGYSTSFNREKPPVIKGFTFGIVFRFTNNKDVYGHLKML